MKAGRLRHRIWVDEPVATQDNTGAEIIVWTARGQVAASIDPIGGREALRAGAAIAEMDTRITVRWSPLTARVNAKWRLRWARDVGNGPVEIIFNIARPPAEKDMGMREIEFMCSSGANLG